MVPSDVALTPRSEFSRAIRHITCGKSTCVLSNHSPHARRHCQRRSVAGSLALVFSSSSHRSHAQALGNAARRGRDSGALGVVARTPTSATARANRKLARLGSLVDKLGGVSTGANPTAGQHPRPTTSRHETVAAPCPVGLCAKSRVRIAPNSESVSVLPADIMRIRKTLGLTQEQFSRLFDVHPMTVSKWERGQSEPTPYQAGLMESFGWTAERDIPGVRAQVKKLLVTAGVIAALTFLLTRQ